MFTRHNQIKHFGLIILFAALVTSAFTPTPPPKTTIPACESIPEIQLGGKGIISCTGFTPNGEVKVIFYRPDGSTSEHLGKADGYGNFDGTFTVDPDRPSGQWTLNLTDVSSRQKIEMTFMVIPTLEATPISPTTTITTTPKASPTPVVTGTATDNLPGQYPDEFGDSIIMESLARSGIAILILLGCSSGVAIGLIFLLVKLWRASGHGVPPTPPPENNDFGDEVPLKEEVVKPPEPPAGPPPAAQAPPMIEGPEGLGAGLPRQGPCGFSSKGEKKVFGGWRFGGSLAGEITDPEKPPHTHVIWERDVWLESEEYGPCPLPIDHAGDHQPRLLEKILQGTEKLTVHYDAFIKGNDAKKLEPAADGQPPANPEPVDAELQFTPAGE